MQLVYVNLMHFNTLPQNLDKPILILALLLKLGLKVTTMMSYFQLLIMFYSGATESVLDVGMAVVCAFMLKLVLNVSLCPHVK